MSEKDKIEIGACATLYDEMIRDMLHCRKKDFPKEKEIELCFQIASNYYHRLMGCVRNGEFLTKKDEVLFFKKIKPLFLAEIELGGLLTHAELFKGNVTDPGELERFYQRELQRIEKFIRDNAAFHAYITSGSVDNDDTCFTNIAGEEFQSAYDGLMGTWLALQEYTGQIQHEVSQLKDS